MKQKIKTFVKLVRDFVVGLANYNPFLYAAGASYYLFMSMVPVLMIVCCILPYTPLNKDVVLSYVQIYFLGSFAEVVRKVVDIIYRSSSTTLTVSILLTILPASASMKSLILGMNAAYKIKHKENYIVFTIRGLLYMVLMFFMIVASLVFMVYGDKLLKLLRLALSERGLTSFFLLNWVLSKLRYFLVMLVLFPVFMIMYSVIPERRMRFRSQIPGAIFSSIVWVLFSYGYTLYVNISNNFGAVGYIGTIMVAMMWIYFCLVFLLIGMYINAFITLQKEGTFDPELTPVRWKRVIKDNLFRKGDQ